MTRSLLEGLLLKEFHVGVDIEGDIDDESMFSLPSSLLGIFVSNGIDGVGVCLEVEVLGIVVALDVGINEGSSSTIEEGSNDFVNAKVGLDDASVGSTTA